MSGWCLVRVSLCGSDGFYLVLDWTYTHFGVSILLVDLYHLSQCRIALALPGKTLFLIPKIFVAYLVLW